MANGRADLHLSHVVGTLSLTVVGVDRWTDPSCTVFSCMLVHTMQVVPSSAVTTQLLYGATAGTRFRLQWCWQCCIPAAAVVVVNPQLFLHLARLQSGWA